MDDLRSEALALAAELTEQMKYLRDIGVTHVDVPGEGSPLALTGPTLEANSVADRSIDIQTAGHSDSKTALANRNTAAEPPKETMPAVASRPVAPKEQMAEKPHTPQVNLFGEIEPAPAKPSAIASSRTPGIPSLEGLPKDESLQAIRDDIGDCKRCRLCEHRTKIVFGEGNPQAELMFVGEGPGADEDISGRPFVGRAGKLLDKIIEAIGMRREEVYIANAVKCRPPGNRTPERDEVATCENFLFRQISFVNPKVIVVLGAAALQCLFGPRETITRSRGQWRDWNGYKVMVTFHPAYLLRSPDKKRETWEDMKKVRDYLKSN